MCLVKLQARVLCKVMFLRVARFLMGTYPAKVSSMLARVPYRPERLAVIPSPRLALLYGWTP
jgi:hypothetical protein